MTQTFFARRALLILLVVFFAIPFTMRGARMAVQNMRNDVKDWLPKDFEETADLEWFRDHFAGEQFIVASWEGCTGRKGDDRFRLFMEKQFRQTAPSERSNIDNDADANGSGTSSDYFDEELGLYVRQLTPEQGAPDVGFVGDRFGLYSVDKDQTTGKWRFENWGGQRERWLRGSANKWYYILPNGDLYRWSGKSTVLSGLFRLFDQWYHGTSELIGQRVASLGKVDGPWYYANPRRLDASLFKSVITGPSLLHDLTQREGRPLDEKTARERLDGIVFGPDGKQTCFIVTLTETAMKNLHLAVGRGLMGKPRGRLLRLAEQSGIALAPTPSFLPPPLNMLTSRAEPVSAPTLRLGGSAVDNVAIDEEGQITLVRLVGLSVILGVTLAWISFRSIYVTIILFLVGGVSAVTSLAFIWWFGSSVDAVMMSMPSLVYVLGLSGAVHIVNYYRDAAQSKGLVGAPERALRLGWKPCTLAAITTSLGLLSLTTSNIIPIQKFGLYSALGVVATLFILFTYLPAALQTWPPGYHIKCAERAERRKKDFNNWVNRFWLTVGRFSIRRCGLVTTVGIISLIVMGIGVTKINTSIQLLKLFDSNATIIRDYRWLEAKLGNLVPMEIVVRVDSERFATTGAADNDDASPLQRRLALSFLDRINIVKNVQNEIERQWGSQKNGIIGNTMSATTFVSDRLLNPSRMQRGGISRSMEQHRDDFLDADYLRNEEGTGAELWRLSLRLEALGDTDYGAFVGELKQVVEPVMSAYRYREDILQALFEQNVRRDGIVFFVGTSSPAQDGDVQPRGPGEGIPIDQTAIVQRTLIPLIQNTNNRVFHIPAHLPVSEESRKQLTDSFANANCIVVLRDMPALKLDQIVSEPSKLIDATDYAYDAGAASSTSSADLQSDVSAIYTGVVPVVYKAQRTLLESLIQSTGWAFVMIAIVMMVLVRSPRAGLVSMLPNIFPVVMVFGAMGWQNILVDIGTMMTASVAMGVAVDDTIHFLTWFRRGIDRGKGRHAAIILAYKRCATAMTQTTLIGGLGLSIFALSTFTPTQRFGVMMLLLMSVALVGDLVFLPAILASPLGRVFSGKWNMKRGSSRRAAEQTSGAEMRTEHAHDVRPVSGVTQGIQRQDMAPRR